MNECGCERGGDCTKTTVCAIDSALQDQKGALTALIQDYRDGFAPDQPPHDLGSFMEELTLVIES